MSDIGKRFDVLRGARLKHLNQLRTNSSLSEKDKDGGASNSLAGTLRFLAVADYVLDKDVEAFRSKLAEAAILRKRIIERFDAGEPVSPSYVSMMVYKVLFNALASGDRVLTKELAALMGGREEIESEYDRPFDIALGYALKNIIAMDDVSALQQVEMLEAACQESANFDFKGYPAILRAILNQDRAAADAGLRELIAGHRRQCSGRGLFNNMEDEMLSVWGVGLANLARMRGVPVGSVDPLIPVDILV